MADRQASSGTSGTEEVMHVNPRIERDRQMILDARKKGRGALAGVFVRLSGPGWLQSATTLGSSSLAGSLFLGVIGLLEARRSPRPAPAAWPRSTPNATWPPRGCS